MHIWVGVEIRGLRIDTEQMLQHVTFNLSMAWRDGRIIFYNLKEDLSLNTVTTNGSIWTPLITFANSMANDATLDDGQTTTSVLREKLSGTGVPHLPEEGGFRHMLSVILTAV